MKTVDEVAINKEYELGEGNILSTEPHEKSQITLCDTKRPGFRHYYYWKNRQNGGYKYTTPFTVDKDGSIYQHYSSHYLSVVMRNKIIDSSNIYISLVNEGRLVKNNGDHYNLLGEKVDVEPFRCEWRGGKLWAPYTKEQLEGVIELCEYLCNEHGITSQVMRSNTFFNYVEDFKGVAYKSNYNAMFKDINPSWYFGKFKKRIEKK